MLVFEIVRFSLGWFSGGRRESLCFVELFRVTEGLRLGFGFRSIIGYSFAFRIFFVLFFGVLIIFVG